MMITHDKAMGTTMSAPDVPAGWLTTEDIASMAGCSTETVTRAIHAGGIPGAWKRGIVWLIPRQEGIDWAEGYIPYEGLRKQE